MLTARSYQLYRWRRNTQWCLDLVIDTVPKVEKNHRRRRWFKVWEYNPKGNTYPWTYLLVEFVFTLKRIRCWLLAIYHLKISIGRTDLGGGSFDSIIHSITTKFAYTARWCDDFSGHGDSSDHWKRASWQSFPEGLKQLLKNINNNLSFIISVRNQIDTFVFNF